MKRAIASFVENLEGRRLLSATVVGEILLVSGEREAENEINVGLSDDGTKITVAINDGEEQSFDVDSLIRIGIRGGRLNDEINVSDEVTLKVRIFGGGGDDLINTGGGNSIVFAGHGNDTVNLGDAERNAAHGEGGNDDINGGAGKDLIHGGRGDDDLSGAGEKDHIFGGGGINTIDGGEGDDRLFGVFGTNTITAGDGADKIVVSKNDEVTDFNEEEDTLRELSRRRRHRPVWL